MITPEEYVTLMELCQNRRGIFKDMKIFDQGQPLSYELPLAEVVTDFFDQLSPGLAATPVWNTI